MPSCAALNPCPEAAAFRRAPAEVMRLARMGCFHRTRLSFLQQLLRRVQGEGWRFERRQWHIDARGVGHAVYTVHAPARSYSLVCFAHDLPDDQRSDRVIATAWDATFTLFDGVPDSADIERLRCNVPYQEAGRIGPTELTLSRANRSVRLFEHVIDSLARGEQPEATKLTSAGYLMRTTAVYGSGKFGAADRLRISTRAELKGPFQAEMLTVWLIRSFSVDLVEHLAQQRGGGLAVTLDPDNRRRIGVGNSTGLGMAPFLMNHPVLLNNWMMAREEALARVRSLNQAGSAVITAFRVALDAARDNARLWQSEHPLQMRKIAALRADLDRIARHANDARLALPRPWNALWTWAGRTLSLEGQEALVSLMLEPHGALVDGLSDCMDADEDTPFRIDGAMSVAALKTLLSTDYAWALEVDYSAADADARFWYVSEEKLEPRLGERYHEAGAGLEQPLGIGRDVKMLYLTLADWPDESRVADLLSAHSEHRHVVRRVQIAVNHPYAEIRDNLICATLLPIDLLRCKLSFFGASRFDPRSDRWVRICLFQDAPYPHECLDSEPLAAAS